MPNDTDIAEAARAYRDAYNVTCAAAHTYMHNKDPSKARQLKQLADKAIAEQDAARKALFAALEA